MVNMRDLIALVENAQSDVPPEIVAPIVTFKNITPRHKQIFIDGVKAGNVMREWETIGPRGPGDKAKKELLWGGNFVFDGTELRIGRTEKTSDLLPKINRLIRSHQVRKSFLDDIKQASKDL